MPNIETIVREIQQDLVPEFERKLRAYLADQDKEWLIEQIVRLTLDVHSLEEKDRRQSREEEHHKRQQRAERVKNLNLDINRLLEFVQSYQEYGRDRLIEEKFLSTEAPGKGSESIAEEFRSEEGNKLLEHAKDMLFGFLFGDEDTNTQFDRTQRQLLTLTLPRSKSEALDFMKATTELNATGTWQDPQSGAQDVHTENVVLEIEYGETGNQEIGDGIITALRLINNLEINEEVLYGRMEKVEQSTLVS